MPPNRILIFGALLMIRVRGFYCWLAYAEVDPAFGTG